MGWPGASVCGVVLAGGRSRRMGADKALLPWEGSTMLASVVEALLSRLPFVVVVAARGQELPALPGMPDDSIAVVTDRAPGEGPLRGLEGGLAAAAAHGYGWAVAVATDMPLLTGEVVELLRDAAVEACRDAHVDAVVAVAEGRDQPLAAVYRSGLGEKIGAVLASGISSLHGFLDGLAVRRVALTGARAQAVTNVNTPHDVERARRCRSDR